MKLPKVKVLSRYQAYQLIAEGTYWLTYYAKEEDFWKENYLISINSLSEYPLVEEFNLSPPPGRCLTLEFDDIEPHFYRMSGDHIVDCENRMGLFKPEQAVEVLEFLKYMDKTKNLVIHCTAGISRSGAIGSFARQWLGVDYEDFKKANPQVIPNSHVLLVLNQVYEQELNSVGGQ